MATIVSTLFCSLDGVAEIDPAWHFPYFDQNMGQAVTADYADVDLLLLGRVTYDSFAGAWPQREAEGGEDAPFASQLGDLRKVVATNRPNNLGWRNVEATSDLLATTRELHRSTTVGKVLVPGSISVVRQLLEAEELDELRMLVHPVIAGAGRRIFADRARQQPLQLRDSQTFPTGVVRLIYVPSALPGAADYEDAAAQLARPQG
jgi:dihydrofolate reductase